MDNQPPILLNWDKNFIQPGLAYIPCPADMSCFFHGVAMATLRQYWTQSMNGKFISRREIVLSLRDDLAQRLTEDKYRALGKGMISEAAEKYGIKELSRDEMAANLSRPDKFVGESLWEFVSDQFGYDIFVLDKVRQDLYPVTNPHTLFKGRKCIVLLYDQKRSHFDLIVIVDDVSKGKYRSSFGTDDNFIRVLRSRIFNPPTSDY